MSQICSLAVMNAKVDLECEFSGTTVPLLQQENQFLTTAFRYQQISTYDNPELQGRVSHILFQMAGSLKGPFSKVASSRTGVDNRPYEQFPAMETSRVSIGMVAMALTVSSFISFVIGRAGSIYLFYSSQGAVVQRLHKLQQSDHASLWSTFDFPVPALSSGKSIPPTQYTSKHFDTSKSVVSSRWLAASDSMWQAVDPKHRDRPDIHPELHNSTQDVEHLPQGQHLMIDIEYVDSDFLNSEERLSNAMVDLVKQSGLTLLSYHCHGLSPNGVSCAGVLLESHIAFHTWPKDGVITLDLFTCGDESLLPKVPVAELLFGIPQADGAGQEPHSVWAHKLRGFEDLNDDDEDDNNNINGGESEATDFYDFPIGRMTDFKQKVRLCVHVSISVHQL